MTLAAGTRLGPYEILAPLGAGGMGEVYRAWDTRLLREVAIKIPPEQLARDPAAMARFEREARAVAKLSHPNILEIHDFGREGETVFAVTELLRGETLRQRMVEKALPWRRAVEVGLAVSEGLASAHEHGIIHRDLKPENIFLTVDGRVKILDFGLARQSEAKEESRSLAPTSTATGAVMGTIGYMAPEQVRGQRADARTDLFALGCVLYEMVTGRRAFSAENSADVLVAILREEPKDPCDLVPDLPEEFRLLILRCLEKNPEARFQSARDLAFALKLAGTVPSRLRPPPAKRRKRAVAVTVATAALLAVAVLIALRMTGSRGEDAPVDSLAVLPFVNASGNPETQYLCDGLTESVINNLSQLAGLRVLPRTAVFAYKGESDARRAGRALGVAALVSGTVSLRGDNLVVQSELTDVRTGAQLWGRQYQQKLSEAFAVEQQIALEISQSLRPKLSEREESRLAKRRTPDPEAYLLYLNGRHQWNRRGEGVLKSIEFFSRAIEKDPDYALPFVGLADAYVLLGFYGVLAPQEAMPKAREAARRALELDERIAEAHATLADVLYLYEWDWSGAEASFRRAIALNPNYPTARQWYASFLAVLGRLEESQAEILKAQSLDPSDPVILTDVGLTRYYSGDYEGAVAGYRKALDVDPGFSLARIYLGLAHLRKGLNREAVHEFERATRLEPGNPDPIALLGYAHAVAGRRENAQAVLQQLKDLKKERYVSAFPIAFVYVGLGDRDRAFEWLERAYEERAPRLVYLEVEPAFDPIRSDPRFRDLLRRLRFPAPGNGTG